MIKSGEALKEAIPFIRRHKLWTEFKNYTWLVVLSVIISLLFSYIVFQNISSYYFAEEVTAPMDLVVDPALTEKVENLKAAGKRGAITSGTNYLLVILLEMVVFFFAFSAIKKLKKTQDKLVFKDFLNAELRMIKVMFLNFLKGIVVNVLLSIIFNLMGMKFLTPVLMFFVYSYFMGYAFLDNYNEVYKASIRESQRTIRHNVGAALLIGLVVTLIIYIPIIGPLLGPIIGSVAASIYAHEENIHLSLFST